MDYKLKYINQAKVTIENLQLNLPEAVVQRCSVKKVFLEILLNSQENPCVRVPFLLEKRL